MASIQKRPDGQWRARYRDPSGTEHAKHFPRKVEAQRWLDEVTTSIITGQYVDPRAGRETVAEYVIRWQASQAWRPATAHRIEGTLRRHVLPTFGATPIANVRPSEVQAWTKRLSTELAPSSVRVVYAVLRSLMHAAVLDRVIVSTPCVRVALPTVPRTSLAIPTAEEVRALGRALPRDLEVVVYLAAGLGLRPGEVFGLDIGDVDFLRRSVAVERQLTERGLLAPLKTDGSQRVVPLPAVVGDTLAQHLAATGRRNGLVLTSASGEPIKRNTFTKIWQRAVTRSGLARGMRLHDLRH